MSADVEAVIRMVREDMELTERIEAEAKREATAILHSYLSPEHKVYDMKAFMDGLVQSLISARQKGHEDIQRGQVVSL